MTVLFRATLLAIGFSAVFFSASATPTTQTISFTGNITSSQLDSAYFSSSDWWTGGVSGAWTVTSDGLDNFTDVNASSSTFGSHDYNMANNYAFSCYGEQTNTAGTSIGSRTFSGRGNDVFPNCSQPITYYDRLDLDLDAGTGFLQEYYAQSGYFYNYQVWFNITSVDGEPVTATTTLTPAPEPISLSLLGAGLAGAAAMRRRKRA